MIVETCEYNPDRDIKAVSPDGWLDLKSAFTNGVVPGNLDFEDMDSNGIDDPSVIGSSPRDPFQAMRLKSAAAAKLKAAAAKSEAASADTGNAGGE